MSKATPYNGGYPAYGIHTTSDQGNVQACSPSSILSSAHIRGLDLIVKRFNEGFVSGRYQVGNAVLYVGNGAGLWPGFPLRLGRASDITHIILRANPAPHILK